MIVTVKSGIVGVLGESEVLLPGLISAALAANDRIKLRLSLMQEAVAKAREPARAARGFAPELRAAGLDAEMPESALGQARLLGPDMLFLPGAGALLGGLKTDLDAMLAPLTTAATAEADALAARVQALQPALAPQAADEIALSRIGALTSAGRESGDKFHVLVMDLHKALNQLAVRPPPRTLDGAMVHGPHRG